MTLSGQHKMAVPFSVCSFSTAFAPLYSRVDSSFPANLSSRLILPTLPKLHSRSPASFHCWSQSFKEQVPQFWKWRTRISFSFLTKTQDVESLKEDLLEAIAPLDRGADATPENQKLIDQIARKLEAANKVKEPLKSSLLNGKWELLYTTSESILQIRRPRVFRPNGKIYQAINVDTLRAQNMETWPFFNQATANLVPINAKRVAVKFDSFKIAGVIPINARGSGRGQIEITYLDEDLRITRGNQGNLFILRMVDPSYRVPL